LATQGVSRRGLTGMWERPKPIGSSTDQPPQDQGLPIPFARICGSGAHCTTTGFTTTGFTTTGFDGYI